ncbi:Tubulin-tyrosine ligase family protein [Necator americanus]|uniref:Tubulin-tyrosine ligase family protein n=1 Tax=Necator americanus TaxID=51031 RepID=W2TF58_NECAM|nr:Tubulin-tyrosine ligase family protein [Necator americanus]ETN79796.1 Tubulin-tyrosine ligase family protein [Necator americanus]
MGCGLSSEEGDSANILSNRDTADSDKVTETGASFNRFDTPTAASIDPAIGTRKEEVCSKENFEDKSSLDGSTNNRVRRLIRSNSIVLMLILVFGCINDMSSSSKLGTPGVVILCSAQYRAKLSMLPRRPSTTASSSLASFVEAFSSPGYEVAGMSLRKSRAFTIDTSRSNSNLPVVSLCAKMLGFQEFPDGRADQIPCDVYWHSAAFPDLGAVVKSSRSRVNRFPGMTDLAKKVALTHAISSMQKIFPTDYDFYPQSFFLPAHYAELKKYWQKTLIRRKEQGINEELFFIVKPDSGSQGSGIYLVNNPNQIKDPFGKQLVQEYVSSPFLMNDQLKFDFRVYGVIRSINPLSIYVSREGMARFCTEKYKKPSTSNSDNLYSHLTNYSLNKVNDAYVHSNTLQDQVTGSKRLLSTVFSQMAACGIRPKKLWHDVKLIIVKTVLAMLPELMIQYEKTFSGKEGPQCFQMTTEFTTPAIIQKNDMEGGLASPFPLQST